MSDDQRAAASAAASLPMLPERPSPPVARRPGDPVRPSPPAAHLLCDRLWFIAAAHGEAERLERVLERMLPRLAPSDGVLFGGGLIGRGPGSGRCIDIALALRRHRMAERPRRSIDVAFLRGAQEEMLRKALQLPFAPDPPPILDWMLAHGLDATLAAYGFSAAEAADAAADGALAIARWANRVRDHIRAMPGHDYFYGDLRPAATMGRSLFVHAGINPAQPLYAQGDRFWWGPAGDLDAPYDDFALVVRASDPGRPGLCIGAFSAAVDDGCGYGGALIAACFTGDGHAVDMVDG